jgi:two-component system, sensor histidine kinase YesM
MNLWKLILKSINNMKIRKKLIIIYILVLIPVLVVEMYLTNSMRTMIMDRAINEARVNTDRIQYRLNETLKKVTDVSDRLYVDKNLHKIVQTQYRNTMEVVNDYFNYSAFDEYVRSYQEIENIRFYVENESLLDNSRFIKVTEDTKGLNWYKDALKNNGRISWQYHYDEISGKSFLSLIRAVRLENRNTLGVLVVNISDNYISSIIKGEPFETIALVNKEKVVMSSSNNVNYIDIDKIGTKFLKNDAHNEIEETSYKDEQSIIITNSFSPEKTDSMFNVISIIPVHSIVSNANQKSRLALTVTTVSLTLSIMLIIIFSRIFSNRIIILRREMRKVVTGDFNISKNIEGNDEVGEVYADLNTMIESIQKLIHEVYEEKLQKEQLMSRQKEVEFKMLASQINPHFLYNTLETIRMKAHCNKQTEIASIVKMLAKLMRRNLEVGDKLVSLVSEIELVKNYLEIQKFRFGEKVSYEINILCDIEKYNVLPLLLQPIVENAFVHGLENKQGSGNILISVEEQDPYLLISVIDNGTGIEEEKLISINNRLNNFSISGSKSIGISNVSQRIKLFYGDKYYMRIDSKVNIYTKVEIFLPINKEYSDL